METIKIKLKQAGKAAVAHGSVYYAEFDSALEPFTVTRYDWETFLEPTDLFIADLDIEDLKIGNDQIGNGQIWLRGRIWPSFRFATTSQFST